MQVNKRAQTSLALKAHRAFNLEHSALFTKPEIRVIGQKCVRNHVLGLAIQAFCGNQICLLHIHHYLDKNCVKNQLITLTTVRLTAYRMWAISYAKRHSKYVLAEYNNTSSNAVTSADYVLREERITPLIRY